MNAEGCNPRPRTGASPTSAQSHAARPHSAWGEEADRETRLREGESASLGSASRREEKAEEKVMPEMGGREVLGG